jgi:hypothetical protein
MIEWIKNTMLVEGKIMEKDVNLLYLTDSPTEAVEIISKSQDSLRKIDRMVSDDLVGSI